MEIIIKAHGLQELIRKNEEVIKMLDRGILENEIITSAVRMVKYRAPRKTGALVASVVGERVGKDKFKISVNAVNERGDPYPAFLEYGTRFIPIGTAESPRVYVTSSGKTATLPYVAPVVFLLEKQIPYNIRKRILDKYRGKT